MHPWRDRPAIFLGENVAGDEERLPVRTLADQAFAIGTIGLGILAILSVAAVIITFWWA